MSNRPNATPDANRVIKPLAKICASGHRTGDIWDDFLELAEASLRMMPAHVKSARETGEFAQDDAAAVEVWNRMRRRYESHQWVWQHFAEAFAQLQLVTHDEHGNPKWKDVLGDAYMAWGYPNAGTGQFFTSFAVAKMMAICTVGEGSAMVHERIKEACRDDPWSQACLVAGLMCKEPAEAARWFFDRVLPSCIERVEPVTVCDCCCGSGVMLLAAASCFEPWMIELGLVRFSGQDIDQTCVRMARINGMLYGLNGYAVKLAVAAMGESAPMERRERVESPTVAPVPTATGIARPTQLTLF